MSVRKRTILAGILIAGVTSCGLHSFLVPDPNAQGSSYVPLPPPTPQERAQRMRIKRNAVIARTRRNTGTVRDEGRDSIWIDTDLTDIPEDRIIHRFVESKYEQDRRADTSAVGMEGIRAGRLPSPPSPGRNLQLRTAVPWEEATFQSFGGIGLQGAALTTYRTAKTSAEARRLVDQQVEILKTRFDIDERAKAMRRVDGRGSFLVIEFAETDPSSTMIASRTIRRILITQDDAKVFMLVEMRHMYETRG